MVITNMRLVIERDILDPITINKKDTRESVDIYCHKSKQEYISNEISIELIDNTLIILNTHKNTREKIRVYLKKDEVEKLRKTLQKANI